MKWITKHGKNGTYKVAIDDFSYYKYKERKIHPRDYAELCHAIDTNRERFQKGENNFVLFVTRLDGYYKYKIYYEDYNKFAIISRRKDI